MRRLVGREDREPPSFRKQLQNKGEKKKPVQTTRPEDKKKKGVFSIPMPGRGKGQGKEPAGGGPGSRIQKIPPVREKEKGRCRQGRADKLQKRREAPSTSARNNRVSRGGKEKITELHLPSSNVEKVGT